MTKLPDTSEAEKWLDPDTFVVKGKVYHVDPDGRVKELKDGTCICYQQTHYRKLGL